MCYYGHHRHISSSHFRSRLVHAIFGKKTFILVPNYRRKFLGLLRDQNNFQTRAGVCAPPQYAYCNRLSSSQSPYPKHSCSTPPTNLHIKCVDCRCVLFYLLLRGHPGHLLVGNIAWRSWRPEPIFCDTRCHTPYDAHHDAKWRQIVAWHPWCLHTDSDVLAPSVTASQRASHSTY